MRTNPLYRLWKPVLAAVLGAILVACASQPPTVAHVVEAGQFKPEPDTGRVAAPQTSIGFVHLIDPLRDPVLLSPKRRIHARLGSRFGLRFWIDAGPDEPQVKVRVRVLHPPMIEPNGTVTTRQEWDAYLDRGAPRFSGWLFEEPWEIVPGTWHIQILHSDQLVLDETFEVVR